MAGLTTPATHEQFQVAARGAGSGKTTKTYAPSLNSFGEELAEPEEIVAIREVNPELEPLIAETVSPPATQAMRRQKSIQFAALCMALYLGGWCDATVGPLVPRIQQVYHVGYAVVSLVFIASAVGCICGAATYVYLTDRFGFGMVVVVASVLLTIGAFIQAFAPPFPMFVVACFLVGFATLFIVGGPTAFVASMSGDTSVRLSVMYTAYGVAATCAPLVSTQFARLSHWSLVFLVNVGFAVTTAILLSVALKFKSQGACLKEIGQQPLESTQDSLNSKYKRLLRLPTVHLLALFLFTHVGIEVTIGGWIVTFMNERHGGPYSGYVASGFFGGSTVGRLALIPLTQKLGEWRALSVYILLALILELSIWLVRSLVVNAAAVVLIGFCFGPIYATVMAHTGRVLPPELIGGAVSWMSIFTATGGAVFPFLAGAVAARIGIGSLPPLLMTMQAITLVIWVFVPRHRNVKMT